MELGGARFVLQDRHVKEWAENSMLTVVVADAAAWYEHVADVLSSADSGDARVAEPKVEDWGATVTFTAALARARPVRSATTSRSRWAGRSVRPWAAPWTTGSSALAGVRPPPRATGRHTGAARTVAPAGGGAGP